jgi:polysaccharide export outer membrane protein
MVFHHPLGTRASLRTILLLCACSVPWSYAAAQEAPPPPPAAPTPAPTASRDYHIGPGDRLTIGVSGLNEIGHSTRVSNTGKIHMPYVGILRVAGLTSAELEALIARQLRERGLVNNAWVNVRVDQYRAQPVYVLGEVMSPGQFVIKDEMYLVDLITLSGGFNEVATPVGYLYRRKDNASSLPEDEAPTDEAIEIDFAALNEGTKPELNLKLRGGDVLYVPQRRRAFYFVVGDVGVPGHFELAPGRTRIPLSQAVAMAGGPLRTAKMSAGILVRFNTAGGREEKKVDFKAILEGRQPDVDVLPNDIVFIPGSSAKTLGYGLLGALPGAATQRVIQP